MTTQQDVRQATGGPVHFDVPRIAARGGGASGGPWRPFWLWGSPAALSAWT